MTKFTNFRSLEGLLSEKDKKDVADSKKLDRSIIDKEITKSLNQTKDVSPKGDYVINKHKRKTPISLTDITMHVMKHNESGWGIYSVKAYMTLIGVEDFSVISMDNEVIQVNTNDSVKIIGFIKTLPFNLIYVGGDFTWTNCKAKLEDLPQHITGDLVVTGCVSKSLNHLKKMRIGGDISLRKSKNIMSLDGLPTHCNNVDLSDCSISRCSIIMETHIKSLNLSNNRIKSINISNMIGIERLNVENNFIINKIKSDVVIDYLGNPCQPADDIDETRMW